MSELKKSWTDQPIAVRKGEELNLAELQTYLLENIAGANGELAVEQFPGGFSNLTYLVRLGEMEYVLRRPPFGANIKSAHDMGREYKILSGLEKSYGKIPKPILYTETESIIGAPFYLMERVEGVILRSKKAAQMVSDSSEMAAIAGALLDTLVELHAVDFEAVGLGEFQRPGNYVERQIHGWTKRYFNAKTDEVPELEMAAKWLSENMPLVSGASFIHNDFKYDNVVLDKNDWTKVAAVLDWEMATVGDPLMDLGTSIGYWMNHNDPDFMQQMNFSPTTIPGNPTRGELVHQYALKSGRDVGNVVFYYVYGLLKIATIVQQIYFRYKKGYTQDERFANLIAFVKIFGKVSARAIEKKKIDDLF